MTTGLVTVVVPLDDCTSCCTVYCSYGTTHCVSTSDRMARMIYFMMLFNWLRPTDGKAAYLCLLLLALLVEDHMSIFHSTGLDGSVDVLACCLVCVVDMVCHIYIIRTFLLLVLRCTWLSLHLML